MRRPLLPALAFLSTMLACAATATAQAATYTYSGTPATYGCSPFQGTVHHTALGTPVLGTTFVVQVPKSGGSCSYLCDWNVLATGLSDTQFNGVPLPWPSVPSLGQPVCGKLRVSLDLLQPIPFHTGSGGVESVPLVIPSARLADRLHLPPAADQPAHDPGRLQRGGVRSQGHRGRRLVTWRACCTWLCPWPFLLLVCAAQTPPAAAAGDLADLSCRVVKVAASGDTNLLTVELANRGDVAAEPLVFEIEVASRGREAARETFRRVQLPEVGRFGRPAPAGGKQMYVVATGLRGKARSYRVKVTTACWYEGGIVPEPELSIGRPEQVQRQSLMGQFPVTVVTIGNPLPFDMDVLLRVKLTQPVDTIELMGLRLPAAGERSWVVASRAGSQPYIAEDAVVGPLKAVGFELVDWSLCAPEDAAAAAQLLRPAYEGWYRWPDEAVAVGGTFEFSQRVQRPDEPDAYDARVASGRFAMDADGTVRVTPGNAGAADLAGVASVIQHAFWSSVRRPDFATVAKRNQLRCIAADRVQLRGPGWLPPPSGGSVAATVGGDAVDAWWQDVTVQNGMITSRGYEHDARQLWQTEPVAGGYLVTRQRSAAIDERWTFASVDGRVCPTAWSMTNWIGQRIYRQERLELLELSFDCQPLAAPAATGDGAAALRTIWQSTRSLPAGPVVITGRFEVRQPGTDQLWHGYERLRGRIEMIGIGRNLSALRVQFDGRLSPAVERDLAFMVRDRLQMWSRRDFNDRPDFDEFFGAAVIHAKDGNGNFRVDDGPVTGVQTKGGVITGWRERSGAQVQLRWRRIGDREVVVGFERDNVAMGDAAGWTEQMRVSFRAVGAHLLPEQIELEHVFGREFGVETITFRDLEVKQ